MKKLLFLSSILFLTFIQCKYKCPSINEQLVMMSSEEVIELEKQINLKKSEMNLGNKIQFTTPISLQDARIKVQEYVNNMSINHPIPKKDIERSVLLPYSELEESIRRLRLAGVIPDPSKVQYRIYFGSNTPTPIDRHYTGYTAILRICYDEQNVPNLVHQHDGQLIHTIFNVGNICPPNCPPTNASGGTWVDDMYTGE